LAYVELQADADELARPERLVGIVEIGLVANGRGGRVDVAVLRVFGNRLQQRRSSKR